MTDTDHHGSGDAPTGAGRGGSRADGELERTLGLRQAVAIGTGTMVGAGIFVFPGIAAGRAGPGAVLSFLVGAAVALLVALPAAELATAMPRSGGGYYFVSRGIGTLAGTLVGIGQWVGLVFASAFYLVGFGHYLGDALERVGLGGVPVGTVGALAGAGLVAVALVGAEKTGSLQDALVGTLLVVFAGILGYGLVDSVGLVGERTLPDEWLPFGALPVLTTAGLVFTSYLGFAQIATVAGDVRDPGRTLPRAMVGSVLLVALLYTGMLVVSTSVLTPDRLAELGETAAVEVAAALLGPAGAVLLLVCGVLATLSSANASILSASRGVYALSRDDVVPRAAARVSDRFGTPSVSLLLAGVPIVGLVLTGRTEVLAEVASALHLVMYGLVCVALLALRRRSPAWYAPAFRCPGGVALPALGAGASLLLLAAVRPLALLVAGAVLVVAGAWWAVRVRGLTVRTGEGDGHAALPLPGSGRVLVPAVLPDPDPLPDPLVELLRHLDTATVGVRQVPKQTAVEQARDQFEEEAREQLDAWASGLGADHGGDRSRLVFAADVVETIGRVAAEEDAAAVLVPAPVARDQISRVVVALRGGDHVDRSVDLVEGLATGAGATVRIVHVVDHEPGGDGPDDRGASDDRGVSDEPPRVVRRVRDELDARGIDRDRVSVDVRRGRSVVDELGAIVGDHDLVVLGESDPSDPDVVLGAVHRRIAERIERPVLVVRWSAERPADDRDGPAGRDRG